jgi:hypothetical protein
MNAVVEKTVLEIVEATIIKRFFVLHRFLSKDSYTYLNVWLPKDLAVVTSCISLIVSLEGNRTLHDRFFVVLVLTSWKHVFGSPSVILASGKFEYLFSKISPD